MSEELIPHVLTRSYVVNIRTIVNSSFRCLLIGLEECLLALGKFGEGILQEGQDCLGGETRLDVFADTDMLQGEQLEKVCKP